MWEFILGFLKFVGGIMMFLSGMMLLYAITGGGLKYLTSKDKSLLEGAIAYVISVLVPGIAFWLLSFIYF
ncbi:hypothetical protein [Brevibacillus laterosporus]|uniref:hypothetical protein n=1 Tax=Brevibacillus laterosporus TaxID=1465 RepID=UPI0003B2208E|nr:hypothetical protein [Brevibacillus laterosporus]ERM17351.1 hypothetical protein P615_21435 [Brevibacillus laterosporus PE36]